MRNPMWTGLIITCCTLSIVGRSSSLTSAAAAADESESMPWRAIVGQPYPDFVLPRIDNNLPLKLSDYRGRKVLLVHFASW